MQRRFSSTLSVLAGIVISVSNAYAGQIMRAQMPCVSPDGTSMVFAWQGDIWKVPAEGGQAVRLTVHPAEELSPRWSPDGQTIYFASNRYGTNDFFAMSPDGSNLRRITSDPATEYLYSVSPDGKFLLGYGTAWGRINSFAASTGGSDLIPLSSHPLEMAYFPSISPDGKNVVYCSGGSSGNWRNPNKRGTDTSEILVGDWSAPIKNSKRITSNEDNDIFPMWGPDDKIYFISNRGGKPDLWSMTKTGGSPKKLTTHEKSTLRWASMSPSGKIAYEYQSETWIYDIKTGKDQRVSISVPDDAIVNPFEDIRSTDGATDFAASPDGKRAVVSVRGEIFLLPEKGGFTRQLTHNLSLDISPIWLDEKTILYVTGRNAKRELMTVDIEGNERPFKSDALDLTNPILSPDGKLIACHRGDKEVSIMGKDGSSMRTIAFGSFPGTFAGGAAFSWSPDSKWIAYSSDTERATDIMIVPISGGKPIRIARSARGAGIPRFLPNGKSVYFETNEYDDSDINVVDLVTDAPTYQEDDLDTIDNPKPAPTGPVTVKVDERRIDMRVRRITAGNASPVGASPDSKFIWANVSGKLTAIPITGGAGRPLDGIPTAAQQITFNSNMSKAYVLSLGKIYAMNPQTGAAGGVPYSAEMTVNRKADEMALFQEIWWAMSRIYYDPQLHGVNWAEIKTKYAAIVPFASSRSDFYALMNEMIEELDSSHLVIQAPPVTPAIDRESIGWLGIDFSPSMLMQGRYIVAKVFDGTPAFDESALQIGDEITSIDGEKIDPKLGFNAYLKSQVGRRVMLKVRRGMQDLDISVKPIPFGANTTIRYNDFVEGRRAEAEKMSGGKVTYFHIEGMNDPSTEKFMRDIRVYGEGKSAAVVDVRWNGGGNTANRMLAALRGVPWLYRKFKSNPNVRITEEQMRGNAIEMPTALMTNQYSASNAEIFSEGYRQMKIGPIVGEATGGNVLTVAGLYRLWDGGGVQIPFIGVVTVNGESLEGIGRKVDYDVRYDPNAWLEGKDNQMEEAVRVLMKSIKN